MTEFITTVNGLAWGPVMLVLLLGTGFYLSLGLRFATVRKIPTALRLLLQGRGGRGEGRHLHPQHHHGCRHQKVGQGHLSHSGENSIQ